MHPADEISDDDEINVENNGIALNPRLLKEEIKTLRSEVCKAKASAKRANKEKKEAEFEAHKVQVAADSSLNHTLKVQPMKVCVCTTNIALMKSR